MRLLLFAAYHSVVCPYGRRRRSRGRRSIDKDRGMQIFNWAEGRLNYKRDLDMAANGTPSFSWWEAQNFAESLLLATLFVEFCACHCSRDSEKRQLTEIESEKMVGKIWCVGVNATSTQLCSRLNRVPKRLAPLTKLVDDTRDSHIHKHKTNNSDQLNCSRWKRRS